MINAGFEEALAAARAGSMVRRWGWLDRWLIWEQGFMILPNEGIPRLVSGADWTRLEYFATDFTDLWPDQYACPGVTNPPDEEPPVIVEPEPQPEGGGPVVETLGYEPRMQQVVVAWVDLPSSDGVTRSVRIDDAGSSQGPFLRRGVRHPFAKVKITAPAIYQHLFYSIDPRGLAPASPRIIISTPVDGEAFGSVDYEVTVPGGDVLRLGYGHDPVSMNQYTQRLYMGGLIKLEWTPL